MLGKTDMMIKRGESRRYWVSITYEINKGCIGDVRSIVVSYADLFFGEENITFNPNLEIVTVTGQNVTVVYYKSVASEALAEFLTEIGRY